MTEPLSNQIRSEEAKRERCVDPRERWRALQETIAWADAQQKPPRNSIQSCLERQRRLVAVLSRREPAEIRVAEDRPSFGSHY
jgi:hypothetical protein